MKVRWSRSDEGFVDSKCGRFTVSPVYCGCTTPQAFNAKDNTTGKTARWCSTQRDAKEWAQAQADVSDS